MINLPRKRVFIFSYLLCSVYPDQRESEGGRESVSQFTQYICDGQTDTSNSEEIKLIIGKKIMFDRLTASKDRKK